MTGIGEGIVNAAPLVATHSHCGDGECNQNVLVSPV